MGGIFKPVLKWVAEQLFGELIKSIFSDFIIKSFGFLILGTGFIFCIWGLFNHFKVPKCRHKRRGVCYQCDPIEPY